MSVKTVTARCRIDAKTFRRFAYFDAFRLKKRYRKPAIFALLLLVFALLCFTALRGKPQAALIGGVLLAVGLLLPVAYFLSFALSVRAQETQKTLINLGPVYPAPAQLLLHSRIAHDRSRDKLRKH